MSRDLCRHGKNVDNCDQCSINPTVEPLKSATVHEFAFGKGPGQTCPHGTPPTHACFTCNGDVARTLTARAEEIIKLKAQIAEALLPSRVATDLLQAEILELKKLCDEKFAWDEDDRGLPEDSAIHAAHPVRSGAHDRYMDAARMVGAKRSKYALIDLVNWLMSERDAAVKRAEEAEAKLMGVIVPQET